MRARTADDHYARLALYAEADRNRKKEAQAKVDARTKSMIARHREARVDNAANAARRLQQDIEAVLKALDSGNVRAAGFSIASMAERMGILSDNLKQVEAVDDTLEIINSEGAE